MLIKERKEFRNFRGYYVLNRGTRETVSEEMTNRPRSEVTENHLVIKNKTQGWVYTWWCSGLTTGSVLRDLS